MRFRLVLTMVASGLLAGAARAQKPPLLPEKDVAALANELSGESSPGDHGEVQALDCNRQGRGAIG